MIIAVGNHALFVGRSSKKKSQAKIFRSLFFGFKLKHLLLQFLLKFEKILNLV